MWERERLKWKRDMVKERDRVKRKSMLKRENEREKGKEREWKIKGGLERERVS